MVMDNRNIRERVANQFIFAISMTTTTAMERFLQTIAEQITFFSPTRK